MRTEHKVSFRVKDPGVVVTEHLRYAGIVSVWGMGHPGYIPNSVMHHFDPVQPDEVLVTITCPQGLHGPTWAEMQVDRLCSYGVKAIYWKERR